jgi:large subunit ribosomal protein L21
MRGLSVRSLIQMYAVIATGGKQYRVEKDSLLKVEKLDAEPGSTVSFDNVLLVADGSNIKVGNPLVQGAKVSATVERHGKGEKKVIMKFRRRKHYKRQGNHRQPYTLVKITAIA